MKSNATAIKAMKHNVTLFITKTQVKNKVAVNSSKTLFQGYSEVKLTIGEEVLKFSKVLKHLLETRQIPVYSDTTWVPYLRKNKPKIPIMMSAARQLKSCVWQMLLIGPADNMGPIVPMS